MTTRDRPRQGNRMTARRRTGKASTPRERILDALATALADVRQSLRLDPDGGPGWHGQIDAALTDVRQRVERAVSAALPNR
jgi:hypothetical protein